MSDKRRGTVEKFWARVDRTQECWNWTASTQDGYGRILWCGVRQMTHRVSWQMHYGMIPDGLFVCHRCDNPSCVRPDHLFLGTARDNARDAETKGRMVHHRGEAHHQWRGGPRARVRKGPSHGDKHYSRTNPERLARGERHGSALHPERVPRGEGHSQAILSEEGVREIRSRLAAGQTQASIGLRFGVSHVTISAIATGRLWRHVS